MAAIMLITLLPFYWILRTALSTNTGLAAHPSDPLPVDFTTGGFERALGLQSTKEAIAQGGSGGGLTFWRYLLNSVIVSTLITVCQVFFSAMAAYAFARLRWRGRDRMFGLFLAGLMVPSDLHPAAELRPHQTTRPRGHPVGDRAADDVHDAVRGVLPQAVLHEHPARGRGGRAARRRLSKVRVFFRVLLPMASTPILTLGVLTYITSWNDYFWPLMVSYSDSSRVLSVALAIFRSQTPQTGYDWSGLMAATLIAALPMLVLFGVFARRIVSSISFTGIK